jgi:hypothetical protein
LKAATPESYHYLLDDLRETITLWQLRMTNVAAVPAGDGTWRVTLDVDAHRERRRAEKRPRWR